MINNNCVECEINPVENKDTGICASCGKLARKAERDAAKPKKKFQPINKVSKNKAIAIKEKLKTYKEMDKTTPRFCSGCGRGGVPLSHSHIIPVGQYTQFEAVRENLVYDCIVSNPDNPGGHSCHDLWEHGNWEDVKHLNNFQDRINIIIKLCPGYLNQIL